jgi:hypothetical protein
MHALPGASSGLHVFQWFVIACVICYGMWMHPRSRYCIKRTHVMVMLPLPQLLSICVVWYASHLKRLGMLCCFATWRCCTLSCRCVVLSSSACNFICFTASASRKYSIATHLAVARGMGIVTRPRYYCHNVFSDTRQLRSLIINDQ